MSALDLHAGMDEVVGYTDGVRGLRPDTTAIEGEYRRDYMRGFIRGRSTSGDVADDDLSFPDWVNE
jgi:hypothetical protein